MRLKDLKNQLDELKEEEEKQKAIHDYAEEKTIWCGRIIILTFTLLFALAIFFWLLVAIKYLIIVLF